MKDKYSNDFKLFKLIGKDETKLTQKFDLMKAFIKHKLYKSHCPVTKSIKRYRGMESGDAKRKHDLLAEDSALSSWYDEVVGGNVCDASTFWKIRSNQLRDMEIEDNADYSIFILIFQKNNNRNDELTSF